MTMPSQPDFEPPGPGQWALDRSHFPGGTTLICQSLMTDHMAAGMERVFAEIGVPARHLAARFVNGFMYTRLIPLVGGDKPPRPLPPAPILKLVTRLHPSFRARTKLAESAFVDRAFARVLDEWTTTTRPKIRARNLAIQAVDPATLTDEALRRHIATILDQLAENFELHFYLHGHDLGPIARYVHRCTQWGLDPTDAAAALAGASPSTSAPVERLRGLRAMVDASGRDVATLDDVRSIGPEAAAALDDYLAEHGNVLATGYDITSFALAEIPGVLLGSIRSAVPADTTATTDHETVAAGLRSQIPASARPEFVDLLTDARSVMDMRDENGPLTIEWPTGLLRRALLDAGRRLVDRGDAGEAEHALELTIAEARALFDGPLPGADELARRCATRLADAQLDPPTLLGPDEPEPPLDAMPKPLADLVAMVRTALVHMGMDGGHDSDQLVGVGIGTVSYAGRVCTAETAHEAIEKLEPGDVLVVRATSPAFNAVLALAGAVVTANGGALSHAAVLARELGIPAVVGAPGALRIPDGSPVVVDPVTGRVTLQ